MKFSKILFYVVFTIFYNPVSAQELVVTYGYDNTEQINAYKNKFMSADVDPKMQRMASVAVKAKMEAQKSTYNLDIKNGRSLFQLNELLLNDFNGDAANALAKMSADKGSFYQDLKTKEIIEKQSGYDKLISYNFDFYDWELTQVKEDILGYTTYKATTHYTEPHPAGGADLQRDITVWYTPEIPLNFGPQGYGGLPGLILKKCQSGACLVATKIDYKKTKIDWPKGETITRKDCMDQFKKSKPIKF